MSDTAKERCGKLFSADCSKIMSEMRQFCSDVRADKKGFAEKYPHMAKMAEMMAGLCCEKSNNKASEHSADAKE